MRTRMSPASTEACSPFSVAVSSSRTPVGELYSAFTVDFAARTCLPSKLMFIVLRSPDEISTTVLPFDMMANSPNHCALMLASGCANVLPSNIFSESPSPPQVSRGVSWPSRSQKCVPVPLTLNIGSPCTTVDWAAITAWMTWSHRESSKYMICSSLYMSL